MQRNEPIRSWRRIFASSLHFNRKIGLFQLPIAMMTLDSRVSQSTGLSPFFMTHGYHHSIMDFTVPEKQGSSLSPAEKRHQLIER